MSNVFNSKDFENKCDEVGGRSRTDVFQGDGAVRKHFRCDINQSHSLSALRTGKKGQVEEKAILKARSEFGDAKAIIKNPETVRTEDRKNTLTIENDDGETVKASQIIL